MDDKVLADRKILEWGGAGGEGGKGFEGESATAVMLSPLSLHKRRWPTGWSSVTNQCYRRRLQRSFHGRNSVVGRPCQGQVMKSLEGS